MRSKLVGCLSARSERRGNKIANRRRLGLRREATDTRPAKKRRGRSSHRLLYPVPLPLLSQHHLTRLPSSKRCGNRYEPATYGAISPTPRFIAPALAATLAAVPARALAKVTHAAYLRL